MSKSQEKKLNIALPKEDARIIREILELERLNVEAYRLPERPKETDYEKRLRDIADHFPKK